MALPDKRERGGDAFERYVLPEVDVLLRVAMSMTRNAADAEDLVQDTLLRAFGAIDRFDGRYPRAWLMTIMRNAQVNRVRRKRPELIRDPEYGDRLLDYQEAADALGVPIGTVMSRLHRARKRIRTRLHAAGLAPRGSM